jgi:Leucine-rich repeat (LRR) protein
MSNTKEAELRIQQNKQDFDPALDLGNLALSEIPGSVFKLTHLRKLSLTNNALEILDKRILELVNLKVLGLNYNELSILPTWIGEMKSLNSLDCWNNKIRAIPSELRKMENLEYLTLGFNELQAIPKGLFIFLSRLKTLDIQSTLLMICLKYVRWKSSIWCRIFGMRPLTIVTSKCQKS